MAAGGKPGTVANGTHATNKPVELAISLPHSPGTRIHIHLTVSEFTVMLFVTSASIDGGQAGSTMGSFVYAMPDVCKVQTAFICNGANFRLEIQPNTASKHTSVYRAIFVGFCDSFGKSTRAED